MGHPRVDTAPEDVLPDIQIDDEQKNPGWVPVNLGPVYDRRFSTAGLTPETLGRVVIPPEWNDYYLVEWHQGFNHPFTLVRQFEPRPGAHTP